MDLLSRDNLTQEQKLFGDYFINCQARATATLEIRNQIYRKVLIHTTIVCYECEINTLIALFLLPYTRMPKELFETWTMAQTYSKQTRK